MPNKGKINIPFGGLKEGNHEFRFKLDDKFFEQLEYSQFEKGNIDVEINLIKKTRLLEITSGITGNVEVMCDRCGENYLQDTKYASDLVVKIDSSGAKEQLVYKFNELDDDEIMYIAEEESELNLDHYIYESIVISLPLKKVHGEDNKGNSLCNKEALKRLEEHSYGSNISGNDGDSTDPRWDKLRDLLN